MDGKEDLASLVTREVDASDRVWTIGELAREYDVTLRAMRFYEAKGLLEPSRDGMVRFYDARNHRRLRIILRAKRAGFSLVEIRDLLDLAGSRDPRDRRLGVLRERLQRQVGRLEDMRRETDAALSAVGEEIGALDRASA